MSFQLNDEFGSFSSPNSVCNFFNFVKRSLLDLIFDNPVLFEPVEELLETILNLAFPYFDFIDSTFPRIFFASLAKPGSITLLPVPLDLEYTWQN